MKSAAIAVAAAACTVSTAAAAQGYGYPDRPYLPYESFGPDARVFGGLRIEAQAGFDRISGSDSVVFTGDGAGRNGLVYGGELGFDAAVGRTLLIGGYGGIEGSTIEQCALFLTGSTCLSPTRSFTAGGRVGFAVGTGTLLYAKGGYTRSRIELRTLLTGIGTTTVDNDYNGFHVGGGLEQGFGRNAYGKIEYVYTRLRDGDETALGGPAGTDLDRHQVKVRLGLRL